MKRRKPIQIAEPAKYEYPTCEQHRNDSLKTVDQSKPLNASTVLAVVSNLKIGKDRSNIADELTTIKSSEIKDHPAQNGPMITHAKPNYRVERKISRSKSTGRDDGWAKENIDATIKGSDRKYVLGSEKVQVKQVISVPNCEKSKIHENIRNEWKSLEIGASRNASNDMKSPKLLQNAMKNADSSGSNKFRYDLGNFSPNERKIKVKPLVLTTTSNSNNSTITNSNISKTFVNIVEPSSPPIPAIVANRKAFYERIDDNSPTRSNYIDTSPKTPTIKETRHMITVHNHLPNHTSLINGNTPTPSITSSSSTTYMPHTRNDTKLITKWPKSSSKFDQSTDQATVTHRIVKTSYQQKTMTSFAKELNSAPNNYPEMIQKTQKNHQLIPSLSAFEAVRFSIGPDAEVVPKKK